MATIENDCECGFGYSNMVRTFMKAGLQPPLIPQPLRTKIFVQDKWCWGSHPVNPFEMYMMSHRYIAELLRARGQDYVAISHAGHGLNSYGLQVAISFGPVILILQNMFGGVYNDMNEAVRSISKTYNHARQLLSHLPQEGRAGMDRYRIVVMWSEFRYICQYIVQDLTDMTADHGRIYEDESADKKEPMYPSQKEDISAEMIKGAVHHWRRFDNQNDLFNAAEKELRSILQEGCR